ncbi:hypothetical protein DFQ28_003047 [Apophysomyces sp. BC1034]|nr:hypothetical protein DFQ28_003047 [Apophysomyces sp. BC1034]
MANFTSVISAAPDGATNFYRGAHNKVDNYAVSGRIEYDVADAWTAYFAAGRVSLEYLRAWHADPSRRSRFAIQERRDGADQPGDSRYAVAVRRQSATDAWRMQPARVQTSNYDKSAVTPAVGIVVRPWDAKVSLYVNYIEGLSQGDVVTDTAARNYKQVFAPYKTKQAEVGVKWDMGRFLNTLSLFQIEKPTLIKDSSAWVYSDAGRQRNRGVEWTSAGELAPGVRLLGGASYTQAVLAHTAGGASDGSRAYGVPS